MSKKVIRFTGSPDCDPATWLRINHITEQPGPGSAYRITIEPIEAKPEPPVWFWSANHCWVAGAEKDTFLREGTVHTLTRFQDGTATIGSTRDEALANLEKAKARGPL